jgi:uncharacterized integral membrane protein
MLPATPTRLTAAGYGVRDRTSTLAHSAHAGNGSGRVQRPRSMPPIRRASRRAGNHPKRVIRTSRSRNDNGCMRAADPSSHASSDHRKQLAAAILGGLGVLFAALNLDEVEVNWILGTWSTPLVLVIVVSFLHGAAGGILFARRRARRHTA